MEGHHEILILRLVSLLSWSSFSSFEGTSSSRVRWSLQYPASRIHVSAAPTSTASAW